MNSQLKFFFFLFLLFGSTLYSQKVILNYISPDSLKSLISQSKKASVIQYWVPSCPTTKLKLVEYSHLVEKYRESVDFYFIGLTKNITLLEELNKEVKLNSNIYLIDTLILGTNLFENKANFNYQFTKLFGMRKEKDFITTYIDKSKKPKKITNSVKIDERIIKKMVKQE
jgi:hypothetical protein